MAKSRSPKGPKVRVDVTQEMIDQALSRDSNHCMIAESLKIARPDAKSVSIDLATIRFTDPKRGCRFTYLTPRIAQVQLVNFDQGRKPEPFSFVLRGAHVTRSGNVKPPKREMTEKEKQQRTLAGVKLNENLKRTKIIERNKGGTVPDRVGGKTPPLQGGPDGVPFSRRRAFGLRGLEY